MARAVLGGLSPVHYWDFVQDRALFNSLDVGATTATPGWSYTRADAQAAYANQTNPPTTVNLALQSQTFDNGSWVSSNATMAANAVAAPDGTTTADTLSNVAFGAGAYHYYYQAATMQQGLTYTFSCYVKKKTGSGWIWLLGETGGDVFCYFDIGTGAVGTSTGFASASITSVGDGWYRCVATFTKSSVTGSEAFGVGVTTVNGTPTFNSTGAANTQEIYLWGAQLEQGTAATTYRPTTTVPVTWSEFGSQNLCLQSQTFDNASWVLDNSGATNPTVTANYGTAPDGTSTADRIQLNKTGGTFARIQQGLTSLPSAIYTFSVYLKTLTGTANVGLRIDTVGVNCAVTTTWTRFSVSLSVAVTIGTPQILLFDSIAANDETADILAWGAQVELGTSPTTYKPTTTVAVTDVSGPPLVSFGSGVLRRTNKGALIEGAGTNLCLQSQTLDNASWTLVDATVTADQIAAPDGTTTADLITDGVAGTAAVTQTITVTVASPVTHTVYAKRGNSDWLQIQLGGSGTERIRGWYNLATGAVGSTAVVVPGASASQTITSVGGGWYRCSLTGTLNGVGTTCAINTFICTGDTSLTRVNNATRYFWGAQLENNQAFATSYIPTTTASATRAADLGSVSSLGLSFPFSSFVEFERVVDTGTFEIELSVDDGVGNNYTQLVVRNDDKFYAQMVTATVDQGSSVSAASVATGVVSKGAGRFATNSIRSVLGGTLSAEDTTATTPASASRVQFGAQFASSFSYGYIRRIAIFNSALTDAQLQTITI
jgi:hypothetical protein